MRHLVSKSLTAGLCLAAALSLPAVAQQAQPEPRPKGCVIESWPAYLAPGLQSFSVRERIPTAAGEILAIEFGPLTGEYAKLFLFFLVRDGCERKVFSVASWNYLTDFALQRGEIREGDRVYHLDVFDAAEQTTLELRYDPPDYGEMREKALTLLR